MRTSSATLTALSLLTCAFAGTIDDTAVESAVDTAAIAFTGTYEVQNVDTGEFMTFYRDTDTDTTNFMLKDSGTVTLTYLADQTGSDGTFSGTRIYGLSKCASSQWGFDNEDGDWAAVSYACAIGDDVTSTSGIHVAKQLWSFVECGSGSTTEEDIAVASSTTATATSTSSASYASMTVCDQDQQWSYQHKNDSTVASVCADKIAKFEKRHPELSADFRRMSRRALHHHNIRARDLARRSEMYYCIVSQDHLDDMVARAISGDNIETYGSYTSLHLTDYDSSNVTDAQRWTITESS